MLKHVESIVLFVPDVAAAARWYAEIFGSEIGWDNPQYAFVRAAGVTIGFHPADRKCPGGAGGTTVYWEVDSLAEASRFLVERGATLHRGPGVTDFGAGAAMFKDPFGSTIGLNASTPESRAKVNGVNRSLGLRSAPQPVARADPMRQAPPGRSGPGVKAGSWSIWSIRERRACRPRSAGQREPPQAATQGADLGHVRGARVPRPRRRSSSMARGIVSGKVSARNSPGESMRQRKQHGCHRSLRVIGLQDVWT